MNDDYTFDELILKIVELIKESEYPNIILVSKANLMALKEANGDADKID